MQFNPAIRSQELSVPVKAAVCQDINPLDGMAVQRRVKRQVSPLL